VKNSIIVAAAILSMGACSPAQKTTEPPKPTEPILDTASIEDLMNLNSYTEGQNGVFTAFGWTLSPSKISATPLKDGLAVIFGEGGNILVSVGDDGVLMIDDQMPEMYQALLGEIKKLGGDKVDKIINTHWHFDHAEGNRAFGLLGAEIIAQENSTEYMKSAHDINLVQIVYPQQAYPEAAIPSISFADTMTMNMNGNEIILYNFGPAHTTGDAIVYFKTSNVVHMGDVANLSGLAFIDAGNGGTIGGMIKSVRETLELIDDQTIVVPGHGSIANKAALETYASNLETVRDRISEQKAKGLSLEEIQALNLAEEFYGASGPLVIDRAYYSMK
jgi:glyoxylase-like metal-dependent hydrolase (beta-lactamase superfamily II)